VAGFQGLTIFSDEVTGGTGPCREADIMDPDASLGVAQGEGLSVDKKVWRRGGIIEFWD